MGGLEWGAWNGRPGTVRNVPNPDPVPGYEKANAPIRYLRDWKKCVRYNGGSNSVITNLWENGKTLFYIGVWIKIILP